MSRQHLIPKRKRIFIGCEGESEQSYIAVLQRQLGMKSAIHLVTKVLNGGDPLAIIESAKKALRAERVNERDRFVRRFVLLDSDLLGRSPERDARCRQIVVAEEITLVWQTPCHEGMLLRHLPGCASKRPTSSSECLAILQRVWPQYKKNMPAQDLEHHITLEAFRQAVANQLEIEPLLRFVGIC
jgi:hypothetical protein